MGPQRFHVGKWLLSWDAEKEDADIRHARDGCTSNAVDIALEQ